MRYFIIVDMQGDFVHGVLGSPEAHTAAKELAQRLPKYNDGNTAVIFTQDTHYVDTYESTLEGQKLPVPHCFSGTPGWEILPELIEAAKGFISVDALPFIDNSHVYKETFGSLDLINGLYSAEDCGTPVEEIIVAGVCTDICVISNVMLLKAAFPNVPIKVIANCCAGVTPDTHQNALNAMAQCHIEVI